MILAAGDLGWPCAVAPAIGAGTGCFLGVMAVVLLRKDLSKGETLFLCGLAVVNFAAMALQASVLNYALSFLLPLLILLMPVADNRVEQQVSYRSWLSFWFANRDGADKNQRGPIRRLISALLPAFICILAGLACFILFLTIFASGNPVVLMVWEAIVEWWNDLMVWLNISWDFFWHVLYWVCGFLVFALYTFNRPLAAPSKPKPAPETKGKSMLFLLPICLLLGVNMAFMVATGTDIAYLWRNCVPEGISQTEYLHEGAVSISWAAALAAVLLVILFRRAGAARRSTPCHIAAWLLIIQTFLLALSVFLRLYYQIEDYGFTTRRIYAAEAMLAGLVGLVILGFYVTCSGSFLKYARVCVGCMLLLLISYAAYSPSRLAGDLNLALLPSHPHWKFTPRDFVASRRFDVDENMAFALYVYDEALKYPESAEAAKNQEANDWRLANMQVFESAIRDRIEELEFFSVLPSKSWKYWNYALHADCKAAASWLEKHQLPPSSH